MLDILTLQLFPFVHLGKCVRWKQTCDVKLTYVNLLSELKLDALDMCICILLQHTIHTLPSRYSAASISPGTSFNVIGPVEFDCNENTFTVVYIWN